MKKKLFSFVMATLIIFMSMPTFIVPTQAATTAGGFVYEIIDGEVTITDYTGRAMELVIPAEIEGYPVTAIGKMAFYSCSSIYEITVPDTVTSIGDSAFEACYNLVEAYIPKSVKAIGDYVFSGTDLVSVYYTGSKEDWKSIDPGNFDVARVFYNYFCTTKDFVCSLNEDSEISVDKYLGSATVVNVPREIEGYPVTRIGDRVFDGCNELTSVNIPSTVTSIGNTAFGNCEKLASIDIPESVTEIDYGAFYACRSLTYIEIPAGVSSINSKTFAQCSDLKEIIIPDSVKSIGFEAFYLCADIVTIDIPDTVTSIGWSAFSNCHSLQSITIPEGVESIELRTFEACYALQSVVIHESVKIVGDYAFNNCNVLSTVNYLGTKDQWKDISISTKGNAPLTNAEIIFLGSEEEPENVYEGLVYEIIDGEVTITGYTGSATELTVPAEIEGCPVTSIGDYAIRNCTSLTSINLPDTVTSIGDWAFMFCSSLTGITLPDTLTSIGDWAFVGCDSLANINIPQCVTCINVGTFSTCRSLTSVTIPVGVLSISDCAFDECTGIRTVYYEGSREQWNAISFGSSNDFLRGAEIIYLGEPKPEPLPEGFAYEIVDGEATVLYYIGDPVELTVPAEFEGYPVTRIGNSAFACHEDLISIELPDTVTSIGESAFLRCFSLENINIPEGVTSIGKYAFLSCTSLENINIPDGVTSICEGAFSNCSSFTRITIPDGVTLIDERAFYGCDNLTSINVPDSVLSIGEDAFTGCYSLESINLLSVTSIGRYAFLGCYDLTSITISASLKTIEDYAFNECENLKTVYYVGTENEWNRISIGTANDCFKNAEIIYLDESEPEPIPEGLAYEIVDGKVTITGYTGSATELVIPSTIEGYPVTKIGGYAFSTCFSLKSINIPEGVTSIEERAFWRCEKLTSINIPDSVLSIGEHAFTKCYGLESINLSSVTSIDRYAFSWCYALKSITISSSLKTFGDNVFTKCEKFKTIYYVGTEDQWDKISIGANNDLITNAEKVFLDVTGEINPNELEYIIVDGEVTIEDYYGKAVDVKIPATIEGYPVTKIDREAFYGCESIKSIELPDTITVIKWYAFFNCKNLESIDLPANLISIDDNVFRNCTSLKNIVIPEGVTCIEERAFENCTSLITVAIPDSVTFIDNTAFGGCASLQMVTIPNKVTSISNSTFSNCRSLKIVNIPDGVTEIGASAFHGCTSLTSINIPASVTSIGDGAFSNCSGLNNVKIPPQITRIGNSVFRSCMFLQNVTLPRGLTEIGEYAFTDCMFLRSIDIPANVTSIGDYAFSHCTSLSNITLCEGLENIGTKAFSDCMSLTALNIPESVTSIGIYAFVNCTGLEEITLPDGLTTGIGEYMFSNCTGLKAITIPEGVTNIDCGAFLECSNLSTVYYKGTEEQWSNILIGDFNAPLSSAEIVFLGESTSDTETGVYEGFTYTVSNGEVTVDNYKGNESEIVIPESIAGYPVTKIGCYAFSYNQNLVSVEFPASVKRIEYCVLASCSNLETVILPEGIEFIGAAFAGGTAFGDNPENWTDGALYIGEYLICVYETPLDEEFTVREGTKVVASYAFQLCKELKKANLPEGLVTIGDNAFGYCASLESINIPSTVKHIEYGAFRDCTNLANIEFPVGLEFLGAYAFHQCTSLTKVTLPEGIIRIESELFLNCTSLTEVTMSANIGEIGPGLFSNCTSLSRINFIGTAEEWNALNISGIGESVTVRFITEEIPEGDIGGDGEESKNYDLSELFTDYEEKSIYEMVEFIDANQATQKWVEFIRSNYSDNNTYMIYLHMSGELTNSLGSVPDLSIAGITDNSAKYLLSTARVTNTDPDDLPGNIMIGTMGDKLMTVEINKEFIEHINSLGRLDGNVMILDLLMNILENEEVVGVSFSLNAQMYTNTSSATFNLNSDSIAYAVCVKGDCNGDGNVSGVDANIMKMILSGSYCKADPFAVDLHGDGILNAKDCLELKKIIVQG